MLRALPVLAFAVLTAGAVFAIAHSPLAAVFVIAGATAVALMLSLNARGLAGPHWPLAVVAFLLPLNGLRPMTQVTFGDIALVAAGVGALIVLRSSRMPLLLIIVLVGTIVITGAGLIGMIDAQDWSGVSELVKFLLGAPAVILIVSMLQPERRQVVMLLTAYAVGGATSCLVAFFAPVDPAFGRSVGLGAHVGHLALAGQLSMFVWVAWFLTSRRPGVRVLSALLAALCLYGVLISGTRTALLGAIIGLGLIVLAHRGKGILVAMGAAVAAVVAYFVVLPLLPNSANIGRTLGHASKSTLSDQAHAVALHQALGIIADHPFTGSGFSQGLFAHNLELQVVSVGGILGLAGLLVIWVPIGLTAAQRVIVGVTRESEFALCTICGIAAYFVFAQFEPLIWDRHLWFYIVLTLFLQHPFNERLEPPPRRAAPEKSASPEPVGSLHR